MDSEFVNLETFVASLLGRANIKFQREPKGILGRGHYADFELSHESLGRVAIETRARVTTLLHLKRIRQQVEAGQPNIDLFLLVTGNRPSEQAQKHKFEKAFRGFPAKHKWISYREVAGEFHIPDEPVDARVPYDPLIFLARQLPPGAIEELRGQPEGDDVSGLGEQIPSPTVLLSDIKNFSSLVRVGQPEAMREIMADYYRQAREAVHESNGVLDKFVGDAVVAIWGFPRSATYQVVDVLRCAFTLVSIGRELVRRFENCHNEVIDSGTRIGVATGGLQAVEIGGGGPVEISFLGKAPIKAGAKHGVKVPDAVRSSDPPRP